MQMFFTEQYEIETTSETKEINQKKTKVYQDTA